MPRALIVCTGDTILEENGITVGLLRREGGHTAEIQGWVFLADGYRAGPCGDH
jgi:hypothetical protein